MKETPWIEIKAQYLAGTKIAEIVREYEIPYNTLRKRITREGWAGERKKMSRKCTLKTVDSIIDGKAAQAIGIMKRDIDRYGRIEDALIGRMFNLDRDGNPASLKKKQVTRMNARAGRSVTAEEDFTPGEIRDWTTSLARINALKYKCMGVENGLGEMEWRVKSRVIEAKLAKAKTFADMVSLAGAAIGHIGNPERALTLLGDIAYKREALEYTKKRALSEKQFDELVTGFSNLAINFLQNDPDKLEQFADRFEKLLDKVVL